MEVYDRLQRCGYEVLLDDRNERPGVMFADMELIGIPHRLAIGDRGLGKGLVEYHHRPTGKSEEIPLHSLVDTLCQRLGNTRPG